jgi:hypothetical protein
MTEQLAESIRVYVGWSENRLLRVLSLVGVVIPPGEHIRRLRPCRDNRHEEQETRERKLYRTCRRCQRFGIVRYVTDMLRATSKCTWPQNRTLLPRVGNRVTSLATLPLSCARSTNTQLQNRRAPDSSGICSPRGWVDRTGDSRTDLIPKRRVDYTTFEVLLKN